MKKSPKFSPEVRERAVRMVREHRGEYPSLWAAIRIHCPQDRLRAADPERMGQARPDRYRRARRRHDIRTRTDEGAGARGQGAAQGQRDPEAGQRVFRPGGARPPSEVLRAFVDQHRQAYGVESICKVLQIAPSGYWRHAAHQRNPQLRCQRAQRDDTLVPQIERVWQANMQVYGADKVWKQLNREGVAGCPLHGRAVDARLGLQGVRRGKVVRTTISDTKAPCPLDRVNRQFKAERPNQLWVSDFTYVSTWQGWLYVAFVIDVYARRIVGWRVSSSMHTDFVLDALEQALYARQPERRWR
jgi:putative transposase